MASDPLYGQIEEARKALADLFGAPPEVALVLGSGLGYLADEAGDSLSIPFDRIPGFPCLTVEGHAGVLVGGELGGRRVIMMRGRPHLYEGYGPQEVALPIRVLASLGVPTLIVTNAAGGLNADFKAGDIMLISDHINLPGMAGWNPLRGWQVEPGQARFVSMNNAYDPGLRGLALEVADSIGLSLKQGVYAMVGGPSYETPAEARFLKVIGADAVGMSTAGEVIVARQCGMQVLGLSCITNVLTGESSQVSHEEVLSIAGSVGRQFAALIIGILARL